LQSLRAPAPAWKRLFSGSIPASPGCLSGEPGRVSRERLRGVDDEGVHPAKKAAPP